MTDLVLVVSGDITIQPGKNTRLPYTTGEAEYGNQLKL